MSDIFAIRDVDEHSRSFFHRFAQSRRLKAASAFKELVQLAQEHLREKEQSGAKKKYKTLMDGFEKLRFHSDQTDASEHVDDIVYGD